MGKLIILSFLFYFLYQILGSAQFMYDGLFYQFCYLFSVLRLSVFTGLSRL